MNCFIISDTHFFHDTMVENGYRPEGYEQKICKALSSIPSDSVLIHLGDFSMREHDRANAIFFSNLKTKKNWLVRGNHDEKSDTWYLNAGWDFVADKIVLDKYGKTMLFSHEPQEYADWYDINIHGHLHAGTHRVCNLHKKNYLISIEETFKPVSLKSIIKEITW